MPFAEGLTVMTKSHPLLAKDHITLSSKQNRHDNMKLVALALAAPAVTGLQFGSKPAAPKGGFQLPAAPALPSIFSASHVQSAFKCAQGCELGFQSCLFTPTSAPVHRRPHHGGASRETCIKLSSHAGEVPVAAVGAAALAGALALSVGSAAVGDGIVRFGMPFGGEVLVPGAPFQPENGYLGMWCVSRVEASSSAVTRVIERSHAYVRAGTGRRRARAPCPRTRRRRRRGR